ncbi:MULTISPECIES: bifunctional cobalt-precorrin-7 (C(5))-methyltransferase/cobalt-precorrin-6B (C(15))-methyltransferase [unclassified Synechocystis]|uniref:bifunctional cobalt-precorrin-7 (C(5))-methyltransferase/cobalt-precorrin-6B (C(15))-methyltransferase n=1 Tax=unclassified Synechocystis TaxID=2640012 RepID=UPI0003FAA2F7|nr:MULTISPECIES: bifunctional cobalt-precorrin-7 (C(5))-methyltransferase/cobalt-precorrin-6B (C(15))-methyltransferase [unclassified Synechocystis]AIE74108.1 Cobalt-precorrin-6y C5-methyltransferase / Cobalt-precorrin-6y C15-methyltransferase [decarboxylating] [Synechocystis sp. PCC 6714]MCT0252753.1 bifunctional cobalt-precorrin-7 (C(5))-methyltransferase/cobalt-precorrin-6B (C(15))-methyltransferase [Synechocystis sp. CS-94]
MIHVVGIGLDGANGLTASMLELIDQAKILAGGDRHLSYFPQHDKKSLVIKDFSADLNKIKQIHQTLDSGEIIVVLASGDPLYFGLGRLLLEKFAPEQLKFHPHVSSIQLAFNRLKIPWQDATIISAHGRSNDLLKQALQKGAEKLAVLTDGQNHPGAIADLCLSLGSTATYQAWVCENLGAENERIQSFDLLSLATLTATDFASLNVVVLVKQKLENAPIDLKKLPIFGIADHYFASFKDRPGMITKQAIRVQILAALALQPQHIIWDIGAGTGSVAIESARLCPQGKVFAIEKTSAGQQLIEQNCQRFQAENVTLMAGPAPEVLADLPTPDRIFIGGNGGQLMPILQTCGERLGQDGLVVMAIASLEHLGLALGWFKQQSWQVKLQQVQISQSVKFAELTRLDPLNPIYLLTAAKNFLGNG